MKIFLFIVALLIGLMWYGVGRYEPGKVLAWAEANKTSPYSEKAEYYAGFYSYAKDEYQNTITAFSQLLKNHPDTAYKADALFKRGMSYKELHEKAAATKDFLKFAELYPKDSRAELAKQNVDFLR